ncbi:MAG: serine hydrolase domain-containing protein [Planctomycetota bacterium]
MMSPSRRSLRGRTTAFASLVIFLPLTRALAQPPGPPLEERLARLCERLEERRQVHHIPGMAIAVVKHDGIVLARGFGSCDLEKELPATEETIFAVGSTTKAFTAMLVAMLADEGVVSFDDPVSKHLPAFRLKDEAANAEVRLRDLLSHRTGLTRQTLLWFGTGVTQDEILERVPYAEPWAKFRTRFLYNNVMYMAAGLASARAAGVDWSELLRARLLEPLGMTHTTSSIRHLGEEPPVAQGYAWDGDKQRWRPQPWQNIDNVGPAGAINSNVLDMAQWLRLLLGRGVFGGKRLVSEERFNELWAEHNSAGPRVGYGLGWFLREWDKRKVIEHGGNIGGFSAEVGLLPEANLGFVLLMNLSAAGLQQECLAIVWQCLAGDLSADATSPEGVALTAEELKTYLGPFKWMELRATVTASIAASGRLCVQLPGQPVAELRWPDDEGRWRLMANPSIYITFQRESGYTPSLTLCQAGALIRMPRATEDAPPLLVEVDELIDRYVKAHGSEKVESVATFRLKGRVNVVHTGLEGTITMMGEGRDQFFFEIDFGRFGSMRGVLGNGAARVASVYHGFEELGENEVMTFRMQHPFVMFGDWRDFYEDIEVLGEELLGSEKVYRVRVKPFDGTAATMLVSVTTGELRGMRGRPALPVPAVPPETRFYDYREFSGFRMPTRFVAESEPTGRIVVQFESFETDIDLPQDAFALERPEGGGTASDE